MYVLGRGGGGHYLFCGDSLGVQTAHPGELLRWECEHHPGCQQSGSFLLGPGHLSTLCLIVCEMRPTALNMGSPLKLHINVLEGSRYCTCQNHKSRTVGGGFFETAIVAGSGMESWQSCGEAGR